MYKTLWSVFLIAGAAAVQLSAGPVSVTMNGSSGQTDNAGNQISPYFATVNGVSTSIYCDDFANEVSVGQTWSANITNLASGNLTNTRYGNISQTLATQSGTATYNAQQLYEMEAWLTTQYGSNAATNGDIQDTMWDIFNPNLGDPGVHPPQPSSNSWLFAAEQNYSSIDAADFNVLTNVGPVTLSGQIQEFILTPEPSSNLLLGFGLIALAIAGRRRLTRVRARLD